MAKSNPQLSIAYLIHRIAVRIEDSINTKARKYSLRIGEIRVLMRILDHGDLSVGQLADMTSIEPSALSHLLRRLHHEGWVSRARSVRDNRLVLVSLTERGREFASTLQPYLREYNNAAGKGIRAEQLEVLRAQLDTIYSNIVRMEASSPDFPEFEAPDLKTKQARRVSRRAGTRKSTRAVKAVGSRTA